MISLLLISLILVSISPLNKNTNFQLAIARISSILIIFSSFLIMNTFYIDRIANSISIFYGYISVNSINQLFQILLLIIGALILATVTQINGRYLIINTGTTISPQNLNNSVVGSNFNFNSNSNSNWIFNNVHPYLNNYALIILFNLIGACALITANDMLTLYIAIETQSFSLYLLSTLKNDSISSARAGLKYFLIGSLASIIILLGISLLYYSSGLTNFDNLAIYFNITDFYSAGSFGGGIELNSPFNQDMHFWNFADYNPYYGTLIFAFALIIIGLLIKVGAAPLHQWTPDVYSLVPTAVTTWLVILPKLSILILLFQILELILGNGATNIASNIATDISYYLEDSGLYNLFINHPDFIATIEDNSIFKLFNQIIEAYGEATFFYPHFTQIELTNWYNSPIINEFNFSQFTTNISSLWANFDHLSHNSLLNSVNIIPLGSITVQNLIMIIAILSLVIGAIGGLYQINIKRLLAYSSINNLGFLLIALTISNKVSLEAFTFYLTQYAFTTLNIFLILIAFGYLAYSYPIKYNSFGKLESETQDINYINQLIGLFKNNPILTLSFIICLFSFAGVPPLMGFFAKQQVLLASLSVGFIFVALIAINTSVIAAFYYLKLIQMSSFLNDNMITTLIKNGNHLNIKGHNQPIIETLSLSAQKNVHKDLKLNNLICNTNLRFSNIHSYLISILTMIILLYAIKPTLLLNITNIIAFYAFSI